MKVLTGGTFDLLHYGHILHLRTCAGLAGGLDNVTVQLVTDRWAKERKGELRTLITYEERRMVLEALGVTKIVSVDSPDDVMQIVRELEPDIYIYEFHTNPTAHKPVIEWAANNHCQLIDLGKNPLNPFGTSTSSIIKVIQDDLRNNSK